MAVLPKCFKITHTNCFVFTLINVDVVRHIFKLLSHISTTEYFQFCTRRCCVWMTAQCCWATASASSLPSSLFSTVFILSRTTLMLCWTNRYPHHYSARRRNTEYKCAAIYFQRVREKAESIRRKTPQITSL